MIDAKWGEDYQGYYRMSCLPFGGAYGVSINAKGGYYWKIGSTYMASGCDSVGININHDQHADWEFRRNPIRAAGF